MLLAVAVPARAANPWLDRHPLNSAHQGGEDEFPSNTFSAYENANALAIGADVLEMDVTSPRTASRGHAGHPPHAGLGAPPLVLMNIEIKGPAPDHADAADWVQQTAARKPTALDNAEAVAKVLNRHLATRRGKTIVVSFADSAIERFHMLAPEIDIATGLETTAATWAGTQGPLPGVPDFRHVAVQPPMTFSGITVITPDFIADAHRSGLVVHPWTINDE